MLPAELVYQQANSIGAFKPPFKCRRRNTCSAFEFMRQADGWQMETSPSVKLQSVVVFMTKPI